jgi:S1-C subfamily serine protease
LNASVKLIDRAVPATVGLRAEVAESHPSAALLGSERHGTGTVFHSSGLILTVNYVVLGARSVQATLVTGEVFDAGVVALDFATGLAVLALDRGEPSSSVPLHSSADARVGQEVFVIASVGGENRRGNNGCITSIGPYDAYWEYRLERAILTTAVNPGVGGAPLFDSMARVIGVVSLDLGQVGRFTLAVPSECFLDHQEELLRHGRRVSAPLRAWVGFYCYTMSEHLVIAGVFPGGPAERAGLRPGDILVAVNGEGMQSRTELYERLWRHPPGALLTFEVFRDQSVLRLSVETGDIEQFFA